jgi:hypothetical protein
VWIATPATSATVGTTASAISNSLNRRGIRLVTRLAFPQLMIEIEATACV